jgi:Flp pilus assembly protein TadG
MIPVSLASALSRRLRRFAADQDGVSAVEFAMLLPLMLTLYLGGVEISQAVSADRKTTLVAHTVGDLISQASCVTPSYMTNTFKAATAVIYPFTASNLKVTVTRVDIDANQKATVPAVVGGTGGYWSFPSSGSVARSGDVTQYIDISLRVAGTSLIWTEASFNYTPTIGYGIVGALPLKETTFLRPRQSATVDYKTSC